MGMPGARSRKDKSRGSFLGLMQLVQRTSGIGADAEPWMIEYLFGRVELCFEKTYTITSSN